MARDAWIVFCASVAVFTLLGSYGFYLTDEMELGAAAQNVHEGRLTVDEVPEEYYQYFVTFPARVTFIDGHGYIAESRAMPVLSLAAYPLLLAGEVMGTAQLAFIALATAGFGGAAFLAHAPRAVALPARRLWWERAAIGLPVLAFLVLNVMFSRDVGFPVWGPAFAMQVASILITAAGVAVTFLLARDWTRSRRTGAVTVVLMLFGTTLAFWAFGQKYHGVQIAAFACATYLRFTGSGSIVRRASAYAVAGLALWSHVKVGGLLLVALLVVDAVWASRVGLLRKVTWRTATACVLALLIGLVPFAVENQALFGTPMYPGYLGVSKLAATTATDADAPSEGPVEGAPGPGMDVKDDVERTAKRVKSSFVRTGVLKDPAGTPEALYHGFVAPPLGAHNVEYGFLMVMPLLALAPLGFWLRRRELTELDIFLGVHGLIIIAAYAFYALDHGPGLESRYYAPLIPALVLYSAVFLSHALGAHFRRVIAGAAAGAGVLTIAWAVMLAALPRDYLVHVLFLRDIGLAALALVVLWFGVVRPVLAKRGGHHPRFQFVDAPVLAFGFSVTAWYFVQHCVMYPPRSAWGAQPEGVLYMFLPLVDVARQVLEATLAG